MNDMKNLIFKLRQNTISPFNLNEVADLIEAQAAQIERLHHALCEIAGSKSLTATPTQFYQHLQRIASDATITPPHDEALQAFAAKVREQAIAACAEVRVIVDGNHQWTALHVQDQCIEAIRHLKELPK